MASTSAHIKLKMIKEKEIACKIAKTKHFLLCFCRVPLFQVFGVLCVLVFSVERGTFKSFFHSPFCLVSAHIVRYSVPKGASSIVLPTKSACIARATYPAPQLCIGVSPTSICMAVHSNNAMKIREEIQS